MPGEPSSYGGTYLQSHLLPRCKYWYATKARAPPTRRIAYNPTPRPAAESLGTVVTDAVGVAFDSGSPAFEIYQPFLCPGKV